MTKKLVNLSFIYAIMRLMAGAFYRQFTKYLGFVGKTNLSVAQTHILILGLFSMNLKLENEKTFRTFFVSYNVGFVITASMIILRGLTEIMDWSKNKALDASISGIAGVGHVIIMVGFVYLFITLKRAIDNRA